MDFRICTVGHIYMRDATTTALEEPYLMIIFLFVLNPSVLPLFDVNPANAGVG